MVTNISLLLLFVALSSVAAQTFQYSRGWTNGKRDGTRREGTRREGPKDMATLERIISPCQMSKLKYLLEGRPLNERLFEPCDYFEDEDIQSKTTKSDRSSRSSDNLYEAFQ